MQFSYNWLQDFFDSPLPSAEEVAEQLGLHSFELEGVEQLDNGDVLIDWDVLPNRSSDCLCYAGIAGEISAVFNIPMKQGVIVNNYPGSGEFPSEKKLDFVLDTKLVPRATKRYIDNVTVKESPEWLKTKLESIGQKSINNVVDITNYVMWMTGQPVHAFDYDKLADGADGRKTMQIRHAREGEQVVDLTGAEHELDESMLVVADSEKALDVAGIKGGDNSGVDENTTRIVISVCVYDYKNIRYTSRALKLQTDASKRYENEVPLHKGDWAQAMTAELLEQECGARAATTVINTPDAQTEPVQLEVPLGQVNSLLGLSLDAVEIEEILQRLGFTVSSKNEVITVTAPLDRPDVTIVEDVIEEVGRLYGLYNIPETPIGEGFEMPRKNMIKQSWYRAGDTLVGMGFYEVYNRSLVKDGVVKLANSLNANADTLRLSLLPLLREKTERNLAHTDTPHFFEIGKVFTGITDGVVDEHWSFAGVLGRRKIKDKQKRDLFLQTKGVLETVFDTLHVSNVNWSEGSGDTLAVLDINGDVLGSVGVNWWEINFEELVAAIDTSVDYVKPSRYPKVDRDVAVWVPSATAVSEVMEIIDDAGAAKCIETQLFDVFEDTENDRKSMAFRMVFQCWDETLTDKYVNDEMEKVYQALGSHTDFDIR